MLNDKLTSFDNLNLNERVYFHLRDRILSNEFPTGARIEYEEWMEELGISRTPLRDAINRLHRDGLIEVKPRSGTFIRTPNVRDIREVYDVRKALERQAVELAADTLSKQTISLLLDEADEAEASVNEGNFQRFFEADRRLHRTLVENSHNQRLITIMETLRMQIEWLGVIMTTNIHRPLEANHMHRKMLRALYDGQVQSAKDLMEMHIETIKQQVISDYT